MNSPLPAHGNNFDALRLVAALSVFISHAFVIYAQAEPKFFLYDDNFIGVSLGAIGASIFFAISGYLIAQSWMSSPNPIPFLRKRLLRIYPAVIANVIIVTFIITPMATTLPMHDYFTQAIMQLPDIIFNGFLFKMQNLPGLFTSNPIPHSVNIPFWTLTFEILCYFVICGCGMVYKANKTIPIITIGYIVLFYDRIFHPQFDSDFGLIHCLIFMMGACLYMYKDQIRFPHLIAALCVVVEAVVSFNHIISLPVYAVVVAYLTIYFATRVPFIGNAAKYGDFSYGLYIYAWPIQQTVAYLFHFEAANFNVYFITSFMISFAFAAFSWYGIERIALRYKYDRQRLPRT